MKPKGIATADEALRILRYDAGSGLLTRVAAPGNRNDLIGKVVGRTDERGYISLMLSGRRYWAHRVIWLMANGSWPNGEIDHIDGNPSNNRLDNLRDVGRQENCDNRRNARSSKQSCNLLGVTKLKNGSWRANARRGGVDMSAGGFKTPELAHAAYKRMTGQP